MGCLIATESITYAIKARDLLRRNNYRVRIEKNTGKTQKGCGYLVAVDKNCQSAVILLKNAGIKVLDIT